MEMYKMKFDAIKKIAKNMGIKTYKMKKIEIIHAIQHKENNIECYGTDRIETCNEDSCAWRVDCLTLRHKKK